ncbi:MAG: glutamate 5-kinase, partial [bacterium]
MSDVTSVRPLPKIQRLVVKIGSAVVAPGGSLDQASVDRLADDVAAVRRMGVQVTLVSSGAIASGFRLLGLTAPPTSIELKQAAAAVGQQRLMAAWAAA